VGIETSRAPLAGRCSMSKYAHKLAGKEKRERPAAQPYYCKQRIHGDNNAIVECGKLAEFQLFSGLVVCKGHRKNQRAIKLVIPTPKDRDTDTAREQPGDA
jgi:hypothetical protein